MKITNFIINQRSYQFDSPFQNARSTFTSRNTIIIQANVEKLGCVFAEAAPLANHGKFSIEQTIERLNENYSKLTNIEINSIPEIICTESNPTIRFALSQIYDSLTHDSDLKRTKFKITYSSLTTIDKLQADLDKNYSRRIKVKLGILPFEEELKILDSVQSKLEERLTMLRLDPNEGYDLEKINRLERILSKEYIEYIEQPVKDIDKLIELADCSEFNIAADESIYDEENLPKIKESNIKYLIVKPALFGAKNDIENKLLMEGKTLVFSSAFESAIGFNYVNYLAYKFSPNLYHGFGTFRIMPVQKEIIEFSSDKQSYTMYFPTNISPNND